MIRVLYIAGTSYCGSTLLSFLLNANRDIVSVGEETGPDIETDPNEFPCSCRLPLATCPFWNMVADGMKRRGLHFAPDHWDTRYELGRRPLTRHLLVRSLRSNLLDRLRDGWVRRAPGTSRRWAEIQARNQALIETIVEISGKRVFAAAAKDPIRVRHLRCIPDWDVRVVHLVRDSCGYVASAIKNQGVPLELAVRHWNRNAGHVDRLTRLLPADAWIRLRYEDLCADVAGAMERLTTFAGAAPDEGWRKFQESEPHIIGNRMRLRDGSEIRLDESWRQSLSPEQQRIVIERSQCYRREYGYPLSVA